MAIINATYKYNVVYIYTIDDATHRGALKIGKTEIDTNALTSQSLTPNCAALQEAARKRIAEQTQTSGTAYKLLYVEKAHFTDPQGREMKFMDTDVHNVLLDSGYLRHDFPHLAKKPREWFDVTLETALKAIAAIKQGQSYIDGPVREHEKVEIHFRDEQEDAIARTQSYFKAGKHRKMLWNAKMRFGKTLCALELVRRCGYKRTLILTHRPSVKTQWFDDYENIDFVNYDYGSKPSANQRTGQPFVGRTFESLTKCGKSFIYFASMQDLRGSWHKNGTLKKNEDVFKTRWDLVIIDEAHEGTTTDLGKQVIGTLDSNNPYFLYLSGTPYNILDQFTLDEIYTWDYVMEQEAKGRWAEEHPDKPNPYEGLAHLNILTYNLGTAFDNYNHSEEDYFEFPEFFRTWTGDAKEDGCPMPENAKAGDFVHEADVVRFLDLLCKKDGGSNYPFSTESYRRCFVHTLWVVPRVSAAAALSSLLKKHRYFSQYLVVNVAGEGDKMDNADDEYEAVSAAKSFEDKVRAGIKTGKPTITLTCYSGRLTTGVTVEEWTGVLMLAGGYCGNIAPYMQTVFRVQSPIKHHDYIKKECYAIDFAPDRTLTVLDDYIRKTGQKTGKGKSGRHRGTSVESFTKFCSIIAIDGSKTIDYDAVRFIKRVNHIYAEHVIRHGGKDRRLYGSYENIDEDDFKNLAAIALAIKSNGGNRGNGSGENSIAITETGMTPGEGGNSGANAGQPQETGRDKGIGTKKAKNREEERRKMVKNTLEEISVRLPLMVFGTLDDIRSVSLEKFIKQIDDDSWAEFMPKGLTKDMFLKIAHLYNNDVFVAMAAEIIDMTKHADAQDVTERTREIAKILSMFHYPDNETVLTPWNVVNMQMSDTLGGWDFYDETHEKDHEAKEPRFVDQGKVTDDVFADPDTKILELNSKSGVYPLYLAYSVFREKSKPVKDMFGETLELSEKGRRRVWDNVVQNNIYVVCKTPMAEKITKRVLGGYDKSLKLNTTSMEDIITRMRNKKESAKLLEELALPATYGNRKKKKAMKFNAIVSNPPYMVKDGGAGASATPVYNLFVDKAKQLKPEYFSIIMPAKWYNDGKGLSQFRYDMLHDRHIEKLFDFVDEHVCFPGVDVAGGVCYFLWNREFDGDCTYTNVFKGERQTVVRNLADGERFIRFADAADILKKVKSKSTVFYDSRVSIQRPFGLRTYVTPLEDGDIVLKYSGGKGPYKSGLIETGKEMINKWKVTISYLTAEHAGQADSAGRKKILSSLDILQPGEICTETYLVVDAFETGFEALALRKYLCTRLVRFLISLLAATQHLSKDKFAYVPVMDFTPNSKIHWNKGVGEIEEELCDSYNLTSQEREFINSMIKPMA